MQPIVSPGVEAALEKSMRDLEGLVSKSLQVCACRVVSGGACCAVRAQKALPAVKGKAGAGMGAVRDCVGLRTCSAQQLMSVDASPHV